MQGQGPPSQEPRGPAGPSLGVPTCSSPSQAGMPWTLSASDMVTPGSPGPPPTEPADSKQVEQPLLDGAPPSASLDTLIQRLVPTADYYPEVGGPLRAGEGQQKGLSSTRCGGGVRLAWGGAGGRAGLGSACPPQPSARTLPFSRAPQKAYIFTFLLSSRLFIEPQELLARVCRLCVEQQQLDKPVLDKVRTRRGGGRCACRHCPDMPSCRQLSERR